MKNICIFYYDRFCEFEVVLSAAQFRGKYFTVALENHAYISEEEQKFLPDKTIDELNPDEIDLFIIPGGNPSYLYNNSKLKRFINKLNEKKKFIAGICGGTFLMAQYGLLKGKKCTGDSSGLQKDSKYIGLFEDAIITDEDVVIDENIITSIGQAYVEFSVELSRIMNLYKNEEEAIYDYKWLKNIK